MFILVFSRQKTCLRCSVCFKWSSNVYSCLNYRKSMKMIRKSVRLVWRIFCAIQWRWLAETISLLFGYLCCKRYFNCLNRVMNYKPCQQLRRENKFRKKPKKNCSLDWTTHQVSCRTKDHVTIEWDFLYADYTPAFSCLAFAKKHHTDVFGARIPDSRCHLAKCLQTLTASHPNQVRRNNERPSSLSITLLPF